jgi:hypothetical protein
MRNMTVKSLEAPFLWVATPENRQSYTAYILSLLDFRHVTIKGLTQFSALLCVLTKKSLLCVLKTRVAKQGSVLSWLSRITQLEYSNLYWKLGECNNLADGDTWKYALRYCGPSHPDDEMFRRVQMISHWLQTVKLA